MNKPLGTAAWKHPGQVIAEHEYRSGAFWLGRSPTDDETPLGFADDRHICLVSGSRAGKGTTLIVNNLALWPGSIVVVDPKGENATVTASRRGPGSQYCKGLGQAVYVLDPFKAAKIDESLRGRFNPLDALDPLREETIDEAGRIADALIVTNPESKDPFWDESARAMVRGLILHVLTSDEFEDKRNLITIRDLITRGDVEKVQVLKEMGETDIPSAHALMWHGASDNPSFNGVVARAGASFANMVASSPKQYESVRQVADRNTEFIDSPGMQRCLECSDFRLSDLKTAPQGLSLYLSLPQRFMSTHYRWLRMMIALTITEMEATPGKPATGHRVLFCLDEFAGMKRMEVIENAVAQIAGYGVKLFFVLQSLEQLKGVYQEKWETFLSNCGLKLFFGLEDYFSREYVSKFIGEMEVIRTGRNLSESVAMQEGVSDQVTHGFSVSLAEGKTVSEAVTHGKTWGEHQSTQKGTSTSWSRGTNWNLSLGHGSSDGETWKPQLLFGRTDKGANENSSWSQGGQYGRNKNTGGGDSLSTTKGTNTGGSISKAVTVGTSETITVGENIGTSHTVSHSKTDTRTDGTSESVQKRRLITEDEVGLMFRRIEKKDRHPAYPGLVLVLAAGEDPIFLRKTNYYDDPQFIDCYDPHPDHPYLPLIKHVGKLFGPEAALLERLNRHAAKPFLISEVLIEQKDKVSVGVELFKIEGDAYGKRTAFIRSPLNGRITGLTATTPEHSFPSGGFLLASHKLATITYYGEEQAADNPYSEFESLVQAIEAAHALANKPRAQPIPKVIPQAKPKREASPVVSLLALILILVYFYLRVRPPSEDWVEHTPDHANNCVDPDRLQAFSVEIDSKRFASDQAAERLYHSRSAGDHNCFIPSTFTWRYSPGKRLIQVHDGRSWVNMGTLR